MILRTLAITLALFILPFGAAGAQVVDVATIPAIPAYDGMTQEQFNGKTELRKEAPAGDRYMAYEIHLPKDWRKAGEEAGKEVGEKKEALARRILGRVAKYQSAPGIEEPSRFEIFATELDYEVSARNWFLNYIMTNGYTLQGLNEISARRIEALYVQVEADTTFVVRTVAEINGPRMVMASYYLPDKKWNAERAFQQFVTASFKFSNPEETSIEATRTYNFLDLFRFDYPASWKLQAPGIDQQDIIDVRLMNKAPDQSLVGEMALRIVSTEKDTTLSQQVQDVRAQIKERGFDIGDLIETPEDFKANPGMNFTRVEAYKLLAEGQRLRDYECWLGILADDRFYYIVTMIAPARNSDFYRWARSSAAFRSVVQTIRP